MCGPPVRIADLTVHTLSSPHYPVLTTESQELPSGQYLPVVGSSAFAYDWTGRKMLWPA